MKKLLFLSLILLFIFTGCTTNKYTDTNGENNYNLEKITDQDILKGIPSISYGAIESRLNNKSTISVKKFSGVDTLCTFRKFGTKLSIIMTIEVEKGNLKVVLCSSNTIVKEFEINKSNQEFVITLYDDIYLKVAGEEAKYKIIYTYNYY